MTPRPAPPCGGRFPRLSLVVALAFFSGGYFPVSAWISSAPARADEPPPQKAESKEPKKPAAQPAVPAPPNAAQPAPVQVQVQIQAGPGKAPQKIQINGGKLQINGGGQIQVQGNAQIQVQANGAVQIQNGFGIAAAAPVAATDATTGDDVADNTSFRSPDRTLIQRLTKSETLIEEERYAEAVELLGGILEQSEDYFYRPDKNTATARSLKGEAHRRLGQLPPEGLDAYELQYGAKAQLMLDAAIDGGDEYGLAEAARRYFHTKAGLRATYLLGLTHLDHGRPLAAALCWRRLQQIPAALDFEPELTLQLATAWARAGHREPAFDVLLGGSRRFPGAVFNIAGRSQRWPVSGGAEKVKFDDEPNGPGRRSLAWLAEAAAAEPIDDLAAERRADEWLLAGGDATRNAVSPGSNPLLNRRWAVPYVNHPDVEKLAEQLARGFSEQAGAALPAAQPLAVNDVVLMRTLGGLTAVDFRTGKRVWRGAADERLEQLLQRDSPLAGRQDQEGAQLTYLLEERLWRDAAHGTFSSDGRCVFCVEEDLPVESANRTVIQFNGRRMMPGQTKQTANRLAAYELGTEGKLLWELGGPFAEEGSPAANTLFLGPPLPLADRLYVLGETRSEIRLFVVDAATGKLDWSQQLAMAPEGMDLSLRRSAGLSPSYADGVLVCPTSLGAVVAVDVNDRSLLWGFQYKQSFGDGRTDNRIFMWQMQMQQEQKEEDRWHDATIVLTEGKALVAPPDGDQLYCLNLVDGKVVWKRPRDHGLYLACAGRDAAIVIGSDEAKGYKLDDGKPAWSVAWPEGAKPSGRGFFNGSQYFVPLTTAEVAAVDIAAGKITARSRSRSGEVPGNLVCYRGAVLSQGVKGLECFYQLEDLRREVIAKLQEQPNDPKALTSQGELLLDEGKTAEAITALRKAYGKADEPRTRNLLIDALLEGLGGGVVTAKSDLDELEKLAVGTLREETYLRLRAEAHEKAGDDGQAFQVYLRLVDLPNPSNDPMRTSTGLSIGRERRVKAKLQSLYARANEQRRREIDAAIAARGAAALKSDDHGKLEQYLEFFGDAPGADEMRMTLASRAAADRSLLKAENLYRSAMVDDAKSAPAVTARIAKLLVDAGRAKDAAGYLHRLETEFADQPTIDGKTGREFAAALAPKGSDSLLPKASYPTGRVDVAELKPQPGSMIRSFPVEFRGPRGPYFEGQTIEMDQSQQALVGRDSLGVERWRVTLVDAAMRRQSNLNPSVSHVRADGHLVIASLGYELVAIDTLGNGAGSSAKILWRLDLNDSFGGLQAGQNVHPRVVQMPWGAQRFMAADSNGRPIGTTGPVTARYASFLKQRALHVVDPLSGKTLWIRHDVDPGSDLFGDDEYIFVTTSGDQPTGKGGNTTVFRVADGEKVKELFLPAAEQRVASFGRKLLIWNQENGKSVLKLIDGFDGKVAWSESFAMDSKLWPVGSDEAAVFTRSGKLTVIGTDDGKKRLEATVMPEPQLSDAFVFRTPDSYLLVTNSPMRQKEGVNVQPVPGGFGNPLINGYVYGFDRATQKQKYRTRVAGHGLTLNQPPDLPMLVFASQRFEQLPRGNMRSPEAVLFCVDKRSGRVVYDKKVTAPLNMVDLVGEPERKAVVMKTLRSSMRFTFTDEPIPAGDGAATPAKQPTKVDPE